MNLLLAPLMVLWPAAAVGALADGRRRPVGWAAAGVLAAAVALLAALAVRVATDGPVEVVAGGWPADVGIRLRADALGALLALVSAAVVLAALVHAVVSRRSTRLFPALMLFLTVGLTGLFLTGDVFSFYVFFELAMISAYALAASGREGRMVGSALIFAVVNLLGSFLFLIATAALYRATGTLEMLAVAERARSIDPNTAAVIAVLYFVAFGVKLGLFPFHFWLPSIYGSAPPAVAAVLAGALANIGAYGLLRFQAGLLPRELALAAAILVGIGTVTIIYGAVCRPSAGATPARSSPTRPSAMRVTSWSPSASAAGSRWPRRRCSPWSTRSTRRCCFWPSTCGGHWSGPPSPWARSASPGCPPRPASSARPPCSTPASRPAASSRCCCCS